MIRAYAKLIALPFCVTAVFLAASIALTCGHQASATVTKFELQYWGELPGGAKVYKATDGCTYVAYEMPYGSKTAWSVGCR